MKNHYISQFIIRSFSSAINVFDLKKGTIDESKRPHKVFYKEDIFDAELEKMMNFNIESRVANILNNRICNNSVIRLTRDELETIKRYTLLCSVRTLNEDFFCKLLYSFEDKANRYIDTQKIIGLDYSSMISTKSLKISNHELFQRTLKVYAVTKNIRDIYFNPFATREMLAWAMPFLESYISFWDAPEGKEFILTDSGMCTEYEGFHMVTGGLDISKMSYILEHTKAGKAEYVGLMASNDVMYENYSIFNISSSRLLVIINPFFRLYNNMQTAVIGDDNRLEKIKILEKPDIWPAQIQNEKLFEVPKNEYKYGAPNYCSEDIFVYEPKKLNDEELIYINSLLLTQSKEIIGFNDPLKIIDSIYYEVWLKSNFESVKSLDDEEIDIITRLFDNLINSPFNELIKYCENIGG
ncbi:MAG: DUF4238 domain-containing protein, partial [Acholeplasmatales bacterium]|nr:DUF4238 domain-containing protein [Acholeplasmatales bacterium]